MLKPSFRLPCQRPLFFGWIAFGWIAFGWNALMSPTISPTFGAEVTVSTADGKSSTGQIVQITPEGVDLDVGREITTIPTEIVSRIQFSNEIKQIVPTLVELAGGTQIRATSVIWDGDRLTVGPSRQSAMTIPIGQLQSVRFRVGNSATDPVWLGWSEDARRGDRLAVRRDEKTLDSLDGTVTGITKRSIQFEMGGNLIEAPIAKLEGVLFSTSPTDGSSSSDAIRVEDTSGSQYLARRVTLPRGGESRDNQLEVQLIEGIRHSIPVDQILSIGYAGGVLRLADAEVASSRFGDESSRVATPTWMQSWFLPQVSSGQGRAGGAENNQNGEDAISMQAPGEIRFRIPGGYQRFKGAVRRHPDVELFMPIEVEVLADDRVIWTSRLDNRESLGLELPLGDARILTLRTAVIAGENSTNEAAADALSSNLGGQIQWFGGRLFK